MSELKPCPFCDGPATYVTVLKIAGDYSAAVICERCNAKTDFMRANDEEDAKVMAAACWNTRAERTCHYFPDEYQTAFDENDEEIETGEACADRCEYSCDVCGYTMLGGDEGGWFEETTGEYGGWNYKPRFDYCPNCGARVVES